MKINKINILIDFIIFTLSIYFSLWLRFNGKIPPLYLSIYYHSVIFIAIGKVLIFLVNRNYSVIINHYGTYDVINVIKSSIVSTLIFTICIIVFKKSEFLYPRSVVIIDFLISFISVNAVRYLEKYFTREKIRRYKSESLNTLVIGAGSAGSMVLHEIRNNPTSNMKIIGFIDDDENKKGMLLSGKKILGNRKDIIGIVKKFDIQVIIVALPSAGRKSINDILDICNKTNAKIKIVPSTIDILKGEVKLNQIRDIKIEDLLGREEVKIDTKSIQKYIKGKKVLITGAGGSIGSELARQIASFLPNKLLLLGKGENSIFNINMELQDKYPKVKLEPVIADIRDYDKLETVFKNHRPNIIFHAAAHKHVYLMELHPDEAFKNNVIGTLNLAKLSIKYGVKKFVLISTDKAVNPKSIMGITKNIAEKIVVGLNQKYNGITKFVAVRFGNVLGSRGSVVPIFQKQIEQGGPVTITHPEVKRYFMTIPEAVKLVLQAGALGGDGEVFILDMGKPIKIVDLAKKMIALSGYKQDKDIKIKFIGLKPGEKLFEELILNKDNVNTTKYDKIFLEKSTNINIDKLEKEIKKLYENLSALTKNEIKKKLKSLIK